MRKGRELERHELELRADAFLRETPPPRIPQALKDYGPQRVIALLSTREAPAVRHMYRKPALARRALLVSLFAILLLAGTTSATYAASRDALPGSFFYGSKIFFERARLVLTVSRAEDARLEMEFGERRIRELSRMAGGEDEGGAERWLREYRRNVEGAEALLDTLSKREASDLAARFLQTLEGQASMLEEIGASSPAILSPYLEEAYQVCDGSRMRMRKRCGGECGPRESPSTPGGSDGKGPVSPGAQVNAPDDAYAVPYQNQEGPATDAPPESPAPEAKGEQAAGPGEDGSAGMAEPCVCRFGKHLVN